MSVAGVEPAQEPAGAPKSPGEPEPTPEPTPEPGEPETGDGEPVEGAEEEGGFQLPSAAQRVRSEKEIDALYRKMTTERARHFDAVARIVGDDYAEMAPCPLCSHFGAGLVGLVDLPEEALPTMRALLGMPDLSNLKEDEAVRVCPRCDGKGDVTTGSHVPGYETRMCGDCNGNGYVNRAGAAVVAEQNGGETATVTGPTVYKDEPADPEIAHLRERGFTVIPPMQPVSGSAS